MGRLFQVERPLRSGGYRDVLFYHLPVAVISGLILLAAFFIPFDRITCKICVFYRLTGYPCPSCGWTRGFVAVAHGDWPVVLHDCPLALLLYIATALVFAWHAAGLLLGVKIRPGRWLTIRGRGWLWLGGLLGLLVLCNWVYRLAFGLR